MGLLTVLKKQYDNAPKVLDRPASTFAGAAVTPIFTVVSGHILMIELTGRVVVQIGAGVNTLRTHAPGNVTLDDGAVSINAMGANTNLVVPGNNGTVISIVAAAAISADLPWDCVVGNFTCTCTATTGTGTIRWSLAYLPLTEDTVVIVV